MKKMLKVIGPGLLFASAAIGTSHLVLSTRAGAHYGMIFFWIILGTLLFKYPFFEFGARYSNATGHSLVKGFMDQGKWAVLVFLLVIILQIFAITGAVGAVCGGLLGSFLGITNVPMPLLVGSIFALTAALLLIGHYSVLDNTIKLISVALLIAVSIAFIAVLFKGPIEPSAAPSPYTDLLTGSGLALLVGLIGFMPTGIEASVIYSIWAVEKRKTTQYHPTLKESLFDFNLGYVFTSVLALMFLVIGAFTVYGSGQLLEGNSVQFSNKLLNVFTSNVGRWSYSVVALAAFGTIYGTFITAWDGLTRSFIEGVQILKFNCLNDNPEQQVFQNRGYNIMVPTVGLGGFILFYQFTGGMIKILDFATIISFLTAPLLAVLILVVIKSNAMPESHKPSKGLITLTYLGLIALVAFTIFYLKDLLNL
jgi:Mn2+/Fe2+ NRAMP family transporter